MIGSLPAEAQAVRTRSPIAVELVHGSNIVAFAFDCFSKKQLSQDFGTGACLYCVSFE